MNKSRWLAWSLWALSLALGAVAVVFYILSASIPLEGRDRPPLYFLPVLLAAFLAYATVGAIVASRRPGNAVGWILCAIGVLLGITFFAQGYADYTLVVRPGSLPGGEALIWSVSFSGPALNAAADASESVHSDHARRRPLLTTRAPRSSGGRRAGAG